METKEERSERWTTILLVIFNIIIWFIVGLILFIFNAVVTNAQTVVNRDMTNYQLKDSGGTWHSYTNGESVTLGLPVTQINLGFTNDTGIVNGRIEMELRNTNIDDINKLDLKFWMCSGYTNTVSSTRQYTITRSNLGRYTVKVIWNFQTTNLNGCTITGAIIPTEEISFLTGYTIAGATTITQDDSATSNDIQNQTISLINNAIQNAVNIITNQNEAINSLIESQKVCLNYDFGNDSLNTSGYLKDDGTIGTANPWYYNSEYIKINQNTTYEIVISYKSNGANYCIYDNNKDVISCDNYGSVSSNGGTITIDNTNGYYIRYSGRKDGNNYTKFKGNYCTYGNQAITDTINDITGKTNNWLEQINRIVLAIAPSRQWTTIQPDSEMFDSLIDIEDNLHTHTDVDLDVLTFNLDPDTGSWIWNTLTTLLNTNAMVFAMLISILSIGVIKLILNR